MCVLTVPYGCMRLCVFLKLNRWLLRENKKGEGGGSHPKVTLANYLFVYDCNNNPTFNAEYFVARTWLELYCSLRDMKGEEKNVFFCR